MRNIFDFHLNRTHIVIKKSDRDWLCHGRACNVERNAWTMAVRRQKWWWHLWGGFSEGKKKKRLASVIRLHCMTFIPNLMLWDYFIPSTIERCSLSRFFFFFFSEIRDSEITCVVWMKIKTSSTGLDTGSELSNAICWLSHSFQNSKWSCKMLLKFLKFRPIKSGTLNPPEFAAPQCQP